MMISAQSLEQYRKSLESLAARLGEGVERLTTEACHPTGSQSRAEGEADPGTEASEEELARTLLGTEGNLLAEVQAALERIQSGKFGVCETCGAAVGKPRLDALPYARQCIACARTP